MSTDMKDHILQAAERVMRSRGLSKATTREIAREAGCSEGTLYNHFRDKEDLFLEVLRERLPEFITALIELQQRAGTHTVRSNLEDLARAALPFFGDLIPITASIFSEPSLLAHHRRALREKNVGPHRAYEALAAYLREEQRLGRVDPRASLPGTAALLIGACYHYAFLRHLVGEDRLPLPEDRFVRDTVRTLVDGLAPKE